MKKENQILSNKQLFKDYLDGKLSREEQVVLERELNKNPFYKDALDGYKQKPEAFSQLQSLSGKQSQFTTTNSVYKWGMLLLLLVGVCSIVYIFYPRQEDALIVLNDIAELPKPESDVENKVKAPVPILELSDSVIEISELKDDEEQVDYNRVAQEQENKQTISNVIVDSVENIVQLEKVERPKLSEIKTEKSVDVSTESVPLISLNGLISVNYSKIQSSYTIEKNTFVLTGTPASMENDGYTTNEPSHELVVKKVAYHTYLKDIQFYFRKNKFKKALKGYKEILKQHPSDLNAHFYSALCYYNINQSEKALEHLKVVNEHQYDTFRQEGEWYSVLALLDLNRLEEAKSELQKVINRNDFYYNQAIKLEQELRGQ